VRPRIRTHAVTRLSQKAGAATTEFHRTRTGTQKIRIGVAGARRGRVLGWGTHMVLRPDRSGHRGPVPPRSREHASVNPPLGPRKRRRHCFGLVSSANADASALKRSVETLTLAQPLPPERGETRPRTLYRNQEWLQSAPEITMQSQLAICHFENIGNFLVKDAVQLECAGGELFV